MVKVALQMENGETVELEISEHDHIFWQIADGKREEKGYYAWNELESDLAEGMSCVGRKIVDAVQVWKDNFLIAASKIMAA